MTSLIINLSFAVFHRQSLSCEVIDKSQGDIDSPNSKYSPFCPRWSISVALLLFEVSTSIFCVQIRPLHSLHTVVFEFLLFPSYDPYWQLLSCALPGWFQSSNHLSKPLSPFLVRESGQSVRSGSFVFETLVSTRTLHLKNSSCTLPGLPCLFQSLELF